MRGLVGGWRSYREDDLLEDSSEALGVVDRRWASVYCCTCRHNERGTLKKILALELGVFLASLKIFFSIVPNVVKSQKNITYVK